MEIFNLNISFWRYALKKLDTYPFFECGNLNEVRDLTLERLNDLDLSLWLNRLLHHEEGYYSSFTKKDYNSKQRRQIDYVSKVLVSTVIKNDIGVKGAVSPIFSDCNIIDETLPKIDINFPVNAKFIKLDENSNVYSIIKKRNSLDEFVIPYNLDDKRIILSKEQKEQINTASDNIISELFSKGYLTMDSDCSFFAIDYFISKNGILPFEWHFPGRGIGLHFLPFIANVNNSQLFHSCIKNLKEKLEIFYNQDINLIACNKGSTCFHELDNLFISLINGKSNKAEFKSINLDIMDTAKNFADRHIPVYGNQIKHLTINKNLSNKDISKIVETLGNWVVIKTNLNIPWWSSIRQRPEICLVDETFINRVNFLLKHYDSLILQELIADSIDNYNHFGELRTYYLLMR